MNTSLFLNLSQESSSIIIPPCYNFSSPEKVGALILIAMTLLIISLFHKKYRGAYISSSLMFLFLALFPLIMQLFVF